MTKYKNKHGICQRKITKFVSKKEAATIEEILASAATFQKQIHSNSYQILLQTMLLIQTGCQYQFSYSRTHTKKGKNLFLLEG